MNPIVSILESHPLFSGWSHRHLNLLGEKSQIVTVTKGDCIYKAGEKSSHFFVVLKGIFEAIDSRIESQWDKSEFLTAGDIFGDGGILEESTRSRTVLCSCQGDLLEIPGKAFRSLVQESERLRSVIDRSNKVENIQFNDELGGFEENPQRITAFLDIARHPSTQKVIRHICRTLNLESKEPVLLIQLLEKGGEISLHDLAKLSPNLMDGNVGNHSIHKNLAFIQLKVRLNYDDSGLSHLIRLLNLTRNYFPDIIIHVASPHYSKTIEECIQRSNITYVGINSNNIKEYHNCSYLKHIRSGLKSRLRVLHIVNKNDQNPPRDQLEEELGLPIYSTILTNPKSLPMPLTEGNDLERKKRFTAQFRRIVREIMGKRTGLVLSSGGAKGFAHIGVIQVLEENNIEIDYIAGSSMGSYIGACWAAGYNGKELEKLAREYEKPLSIFRLMSPSLGLRKGLVSTFTLKDNLDTILRDAEFRDLTIPLCVTATNIESLQNTFFTRGSVSLAVRASCSIPGICEPCEINGSQFIDGGVMDPLPVDAMEAKGIEKIIAVSTVLTSEHNHICELRLKSCEQVTGFGKISNFINQHINYFAKGNVFHTIMRSIEASQIRLVERDLLRSDIAIQPVTCDNDWLRFNKPEKHIALGRACAEKHLSELRRLAA